MKSFKRSPGKRLIQAFILLYIDGRHKPGYTDSYPVETVRLAPKFKSTKNGKLQWHTNPCVDGNFMRTLLTLLFLFFFSSLLGQARTFYNILSENGDTSFWFKHQQAVIKELSLSKLDTSPNAFYFRLWKANQVIDIWENDQGKFAGQLTSWTSEYVSGGEKPTGRTQINKQAINTDTVNRLAGLIKSSTILNLPTDNLIKGWKQGLDGITYLVEYSTKEQYSFKTYWTPYVQDTLSEAKLVQSFVDDFFQLANAKSIWQTFTKQLPYECYINGGNIACKVLTKKEKRRHGRERKIYRQQKNSKAALDNVASTI